MKKYFYLLSLFLSVQPVFAEETEAPKMIDIPVPISTIKRGDLLQTSDFKIIEIDEKKALARKWVQDEADLEGKQARRTLYEGKPIDPNSIGAFLSVKRNQDVELIYQKGMLLLTAKGRALENGGTGDTIKVMNKSSHKPLSGTITAEGDVLVQGEN